MSLIGEAAQREAAALFDALAKIAECVALDLKANGLTAEHTDIAVAQYETAAASVRAEQW